MRELISQNLIRLKYSTYNNIIHIFCSFTFYLDPPRIDQRKKLSYTADAKDDVQIKVAFEKDSEYKWIFSGEKAQGEILDEAKRSEIMFETTDGKNGMTEMVFSIKYLDKRKHEGTYTLEVEKNKCLASQVIQLTVRD